MYIANNYPYKLCTFKLKKTQRTARVRGRYRFTQNALHWEKQKYRDWVLEVYALHILSVNLHACSLVMSRESTALKHLFNCSFYIIQIYLTTGCFPLGMCFAENMLENALLSLTELQYNSFCWHDGQRLKWFHIFVIFFKFINFMAKYIRHPDYQEMCHPLYHVQVVSPI